MRRPLDWFVVALSLTFLLVGRTLPRAEEPVPMAARVHLVAIPYQPVATQLLPAEPRERTLEFGYVRTDTPVVR